MFHFLRKLFLSRSYVTVKPTYFKGVARCKHIDDFDHKVDAYTRIQVYPSKEDGYCYVYVHAETPHTIQRVLKKDIDLFVKANVLIPSKSIAGVKAGEGYRFDSVVKKAGSFREKEDALGLKDYALRVRASDSEDEPKQVIHDDLHTEIPDKIVSLMQVSTGQSLLVPEALAIYFGEQDLKQHSLIITDVAVSGIKDALDVLKQKPSLAQEVLDSLIAADPANIDTIILLLAAKVELDLRELSKGNELIKQWYAQNKDLCDWLEKV